MWGGLPRCRLRGRTYSRGMGPGTADHPRSIQVSGHGRHSVGCQLLGGWTPVPAELSQCIGTNCFSSVGTGGRAQGGGGRAGWASASEEMGPGGAELSHCEHDLLWTLLTSS